MPLILRKCRNKLKRNSSPLTLHIPSNGHQQHYALKIIWSTDHGREIVPYCFHLFDFNVKHIIFMSCSENYSPQIELIFLKFEVEHIFFHIC